MTPNPKRANKAIRTFYADLLTPEIERLIAQANADLFSGPHSDEGYPGFARACEKIGKAVDVTDLWLDMDCDYVTDIEPEWGYDPDDEDSTAQNPESWTHYDAKDVKRYVFGTELSQYI